MTTPVGGASFASVFFQQPGGVSDNSDFSTHLAAAGPGPGSFGPSLGPRVLPPDPSGNPAAGSDGSTTVDPAAAAAERQAQIQKIESLIEMMLAQTTLMNIMDVASKPIGDDG